MNSKEKVLSVHPDAFESESGRIWTSMEDFFSETDVDGHLLGNDWDDAASKLPTDGVTLGTCADFPTTPHVKGTCESCDMWTRVAAPIAPAAVFDSIEQLKEIMRRLNIDFEDGVFSAHAEPQPIESDSLPELIERITNLRDAKPSAEGDGWIAAHRVAKALTNLIVACDRAQDWSGGTRVGNAIDEAEAILAELPAPPSGQGEVK